MKIISGQCPPDREKMGAILSSMKMNEDPNHSRGTLQVKGKPGKKVGHPKRSEGPRTTRDGVTTSRSLSASPCKERRRKFVLRMMTQLFNGSSAS
jgi:hypothetical protein